MIVLKKSPLTNEEISILLLILKDSVEFFDGEIAEREKNLIKFIFTDNYPIKVKINWTVPLYEDWDDVQLFVGVLDQFKIKYDLDIPESHLVVTIKESKQANGFEEAFHSLPHDETDERMSFVEILSTSFCTII